MSHLPVVDAMEEMQAAARVLVGRCRFCYGDVVVGEVRGEDVVRDTARVTCKDGGLPQVAHRACVQTWFSIRPNGPSATWPSEPSATWPSEPSATWPNEPRKTRG